jgi:hypothetical protein
MCSTSPLVYADFDTRRAMIWPKAALDLLKRPVADLFYPVVGMMRRWM